MRNVWRKVNENEERLSDLNEESVSRPYVMLTDEELDSRLASSHAVEQLIVLDAWQLIHQAMRRKADLCYRKLAISRNMDEITQLQAWIRCYQDFRQNLAGFIDIKSELTREKAMRKRGSKTVADFWRPLQRIMGE